VEILGWDQLNRAHVVAILTPHPKRHAPGCFWGLFSRTMNAVEGFKPVSASYRRLTIVAVLLLSLPCLAKPRSKAPASTVDADYVSALATANRFLHAWQVQDHETGVLLLTDAAKQQTSEDRLDAFFSAGDSIEDGFEISRGKKLQAGRYRFPVALWQSIPGKNRSLHPRFSEIVVVRTGKDDWAIDKLP